MPKLTIYWVACISGWVTRLELRRRWPGPSRLSRRPTSKCRRQVRKRASPRYHTPNRGRSCEITKSNVAYNNDWQFGSLEAAIVENFTHILVPHDRARKLITVGAAGWCQARGKRRRFEGVRQGVRRLSAKSGENGQNT